MLLSKKNYKAFDAFLLVFKASPVCAALDVFLSSFLYAFLPTAATALTTANFVDTAIAILRGERAYNDIFLPLILLLLVLGLNTILDSFSALVYFRNTYNLQRKLKPEIVRKHAALNFKHIENAESWELISRVSRDPVQSILDGFAGITIFMRVIIAVVSFIILIVTQVWWAAIVIIVFSAPMFWLSIKAGKKNYQAGVAAEKFNRRTDYLGDVLIGRDNVDERTLFGYGNEINKRWYKQFETGRLLQLKVALKFYVINKGSALTLALVAFLIALTLIGPVISGALTPGMFMGIVGAVFGMIMHLGWQTANSLELLSRLGEYMKDLTAFLTLDETADILTEPDSDPLPFSALEFRDVRFKYPSGSRFILDGLSFTLQAGRHYAFVGKNGAGKTTITKLLTGLYSDYEGEILINGRELREYPAGALKALFSVVYQDFAKYYIPLKDNIILGDAAVNVADEKAAEAAKQAGLDETITALKNGMDTPLGKIIEGGQDISGGQWQRVAIARSLISRAPVKMLDEPTAALDPLSESRIYEEFEKLMRGKTTVFISHRLGSTKLADEILVIDDGKIIERGTHNELMKVKGQYTEMFEAQRGWYI